MSTVVVAKSFSNGAVSNFSAVQMIMDCPTSTSVSTAFLPLTSAPPPSVTTSSGETSVNDVNVKSSSTVPVFASISKAVNSSDAAPVPSENAIESEKQTDDNFSTGLPLWVPIVAAIAGLLICIGCVVLVCFMRSNVGENNEQSDDSARELEPPRSSVATTSSSNEYGKFEMPISGSDGYDAGNLASFSSFRDSNYAVGDIENLQPIK